MFALTDISVLTGMGTELLTDKDKDIHTDTDTNILIDVEIYL